MATGYIVPPISKLPFLNIMTDVLLTQVPAETKCHKRSELLSVEHKVFVINWGTDYSQIRQKQKPYF